MNKSLETTPKLVGDEFLDGFLWGRGRFGKTKTTTRAWVNISHQPIGIVYDIMGRLDKYANYELIEEHVSKNGKITEVIDIHFINPVASPGSLNTRNISSEWNEGFLKGLLYGRGVSIGDGNVIHLSHHRWVNELEAICQRLNIPHKKYENAVAITSEGMNHSLFKDWKRAAKEERDNEYYFNEEELSLIDVSKETGSINSHYELRTCLNGNSSEKIRAISGIADGRCFWFRPELLSFIDNEIPEIRLEARIALAYIGSYKDIETLKFKHKQDVTDNFRELMFLVSQIGMSRLTPLNKRIINRIWELDRIISIKYNEQPLDLALYAFECFLNKCKSKEDIASSPAIKFYTLFTSYCEINDRYVCDFIIKRLEDMLDDPSLEEFHNSITNILKINNSKDISEA